MPRTIDVGAGLLTLGGVLLAVALFLPWFDGDSAWTAFESLDLLLAAVALAAVATGLGRLGDDARVGLGVALAALVAVAVQLIDPPPAYSGADLDSGAWLALVSALLMLAGAAQTLAHFSVSIDVRSRERRRRVAAVDRRQEAEVPQPPDAEPTARRAKRLMPDPPPSPAASRAGTTDQRTEQMSPLSDAAE